ncbi:UDP-galactopyranose mutase [Thiorhodovibrio winogradskyi]|uniref:UDP-galactopyranose mutase n=1 Tax=Thiorhodovibrio winogradskyi TaxID=77007 RepID=A0ABZ0SDV1_9GAMM
MRNVGITNLENWFRSVFGDSFTEIYFLPYNKKIWGIDPKEMNSDWVSGKLPIPDRNSFIEGLFNDVRDNMVHFFYYPKNVLKDNLMLRLADSCRINYNYRVSRLKKSKNKYIVNGQKNFDSVIITSPLNISICFFDNAPVDVLKAASLLKNNKITNVLWRTSGADATWTYFPKPSTIFHRHIHIGNFLRPNKNLTITESLGEVSYEKLIEEGARFDYLLEPLAYNVSEYAYVLQDGNKTSSVKLVRDYIESAGVHLCGRFAEWEYYNMDLCIERAIELAAKFN